jgi:hypothetical protein
MSGSNLFWEPENNDLGLPLSDELKEKLRSYLGRSIGIVSIDGTSLSESDVGFISGLQACGIKDAGKLITAINKHGRIIMREVSR